MFVIYCFFGLAGKVNGDIRTYVRTAVVKLVCVPCGAKLGKRRRKKKMKMGKKKQQLDRSVERLNKKRAGGGGEFSINCCGRRSISVYRYIVTVFSLSQDNYEIVIIIFDFLC